MTLDDFTDLLDRCGGDPARWPPGAGAGAGRLLAASDEARAALAAMQAVERGLADTCDASAPAGLATAAMNGPQRAPAPVWPLRAGWAAAAALALCVGVAAGAIHGAGDDPGATVAWALGAEGADAG